MTIQLSLHMQLNQSMVPICQWWQKHNWGFMFWSEFVKLVKSKSFNALFFPVLLHVTNSSLNALVHFEILREFLQQQYFKIREVNILLKYLLIVANICPTTRGGNGWTGKWERTPIGVTLWTNQLEQRMECRGDIAMEILVLKVIHISNPTG